MLEDSLLKHYPREIRLTQERINGYEMDIALYGRHKSEDFPGMLLYGTHYEEKKEAGTAILEACKAMTSPEPKEVGSYRGFTLLLSYDIIAKVFRMTLRGELSHTVELGSDVHGNIQRIENIVSVNYDNGITLKGVYSRADKACIGSLTYSGITAEITINNLSSKDEIEDLPFVMYE